MWLLNCCERKISKDNEKRLANQILCFLSPNRDKISVYHKSIYRDQQMIRPKPKEVTTSNQVSTQKGPKSSLFYRGVRVWNSQTHCWIPRSRAKIESHYLEVNDPKLSEIQSCLSHGTKLSETKCTEQWRWWFYSDYWSSENIPNPKMRVSQNKWFCLRLL